MRFFRKVPFIYKPLYAKFNDLIEGRFVVFIHHPNRLHSILNYINKNETGWNITLIHCNNGDTDREKVTFKEFETLVPQLKEAGVFPHFHINLIYLNESFSPELVEKVSHKYRIHKNRMFIGSIHDFHKFDYSELGGVRIIFG